MGAPHAPEQSLLFVAALFSLRETFSSVLPLLEERFGRVLLVSPEIPWNHSQYYEEELGRPIIRQFIFFQDFFDPLTLPDVKLETNAIETIYQKDGRRSINLDPGYLMRSRVVLASAKDYSHRMYLGKGIYGEVALFYKEKRYNPLPYTYYDYKDPVCLSIFETARECLKRLLREVR